MSIHKTAAGTWQVRWRDPNGHPQQKTLKRKIDAERFETEMEAAKLHGTYLDPKAGDITVEAWSKLWLANSRDLGPGGRQEYERRLKVILPEIGHLRLNQVDMDVVDEFVTTLLTRPTERKKAPLAPSSVSAILQQVSTMMEAAVRRGRIPANPCKEVAHPKGEQIPMRFLTAGEIERLAPFIYERFRAWLYVAAYGGLRWSEAVGLRRSAVSGSRVTVTEQLIWRKPIEGGPGRWCREPPKTRAGRRSVSLPPFVKEMLIEHIKRFAQPGADGLVFPTRSGRPPHAGSFTDKHWKRNLVKAGLDRDTRIHDLRHTAVAFAIAAGSHPKAIQERMGHASIAITMDRYGHLFPEMDEDVALRLDMMRADALAAVPSLLLIP